MGNAPQSLRAAPGGVVENLSFIPAVHNTSLMLFVKVIIASRATCGALLVFMFVGDAALLLTAAVLRTAAHTTKQWMMLNMNLIFGFFYQKFEMPE